MPTVRFEAKRAELKARLIVARENILQAIKVAEA
jgi:hypothetical protein